MDGTDDYIAVANDSSLQIAGSFTITAWAVINGADPQYIVEKGAAGQGNYYFVWDDGNIACGFFGGGDWEGVATALVPTASTFYHRACVFDDTANTMTLYINGSASTPGSITVTPETDTGPLWIGRSPLWSTGPLDGVIDDVRLFDAALSGTEISAIYSE
jgi:hypothetical protein